MHGTRTHSWIWKSLVAGLCGTIAHTLLISLKAHAGWLPSFQPYPYPVALRVWRLPSCTVRAMCQGAEPLASAAPWPDCGEKFAA